MTGQLTAIGTFNEGDHPQTHQDITKLVTWQSSIPGVATVSSSGLVTSGNYTGTTSITASMQGFTGLITNQSTVTVCTLNATATGCQSSGSGD